MSNHYNVLVARPYIAKDGAEKTAFTKIGVAFPMKDKDGFSITLEALPLQSLGQTGKLECRMMLMPPLDKEEALPVAKENPRHSSLKDSTDIPF